MQTRGNTRVESKSIVGLMRLCWITVLSGEGLDTETSPKATTWRALDEIFGTQLEAAAPGWGDEGALLAAGLPREIAALAAEETGIINFRRSLRNAAVRWVAPNRARLVGLMTAASELGRADDATRVALAAKVARLPRISLKRGAADPANVVTPMLSCLDPADRFPIIGGGNLAARKRLGLGGSDLDEVVASLLALIPWRQHQIKDARDLDVRLFQADLRDEEWLATARFRAERSRTATEGAARRTLSVLSDEKIEVQTKAQRREYRQIHNTITNQVEAQLGDRAHSPNPDDPRFDVLVDPLSSRQPFVLIEVKPDLDQAPSLRMAIGQLLSYRHDLEGRIPGEIRLAAMGAQKPHRSVIEFLKSIDIDTLWLAGPKGSRISGSGAAMEALKQPR